MNNPFESGGCCTPCEPVPVAPVPPAIVCEIPAAIECPPGYCIEPPPCHCLQVEFLCQFSQYSCLPLDKLCCALKAAECHTRGIFDRCLREQATMFMAAHLIEVGNVGTTEATSRVGAIGSGSPLARPGGGNVAGNDWLGLSVWGVAYQGLIYRDTDLGMIFC